MKLTDKQLELVFRARKRETITDEGSRLVGAHKCPFLCEIRGREIRVANKLSDLNIGRTVSIQPSVKEFFMLFTDPRD